MTPSPLSRTSDYVSVSVQSGEMAARDALRSLLDGLAPLALDVEETNAIELVLAEALNNIVEHAYPEPGTDQPIDIHCRLHRDGLHVRIRDQGHAMPDGKAPIGLMQNLDVDMVDMPEGGFGWFLIQGLARDVRYERRAQHNHLDLRIAVAKGRVD